MLVTLQETKTIQALVISLVGRAPDLQAGGTQDAISTSVNDFSTPVSVLLLLTQL